MSLPNIKITTNAKDVDDAVSAANQEAGRQIVAMADAFAIRVKSALQSAVGGAYGKTGTGRFARGLNTRVTKSTDGAGGVTATVDITMQNYRESRFLTNLGDAGYFKEFPVGAYYIFARGVQPVEQPTKADVPRMRDEARSRLTIPNRFGFLVAFRKHGGGESRQLHDLFGALEEGDNKPIFNALWVHHPSIPQDIVSDVALAEGFGYQSETVEQMRFVFSSKTFVQPRLSQVG